MTKEVDLREKELTHQVHREFLVRSLDQVKQLTPVLISGIKIYSTTKDMGKSFTYMYLYRDLEFLCISFFSVILKQNLTTQGKPPTYPNSGESFLCMKKKFIFLLILLRGILFIVRLCSGINV